MFRSLIPTSRKVLRRRVSTSRRRSQLETLEGRCVLASDFGDAAATFGVAEHQNIASDFSLGATVDAEVISQFSATSVGDDAFLLDDEDGVSFATSAADSNAVRQGQSGAEVMVSVNATSQANPRLDAWIDFDGDGAFEASERIFAGPVTSGDVTVSYDVPADAAIGLRAARFRLSDSQVALGPTGVALSGEVEDHAVFVVDDAAPAQFADFGDAPSSYGGARHERIAADFTLGALVDGESVAQFSATATGDDIGGVDDEDGVVFASSTVQQGEVGAKVAVTVNNLNGSAARLDAWIDFNGDGVFQRREKIFEAPVNAGVNVLTISYDVPQNAAAGVTYARFRLTNATSTVGPTSIAATGETEDYALAIVENLDRASDFGDAPASYGVAEHQSASEDLAIGNIVDGEASQQFSFDARGDDRNGVDDEDGVVFAGALIRGQSNASLTIPIQNLSAGAQARLDAWIDFDGDGVFEASERIHGAAVAAGASTVTVNFSVPTTADRGPTFARFRLSDSETAIGPTGVATAGEVEDHLLMIVDTNGPQVIEEEGNVIVIGTDSNDVIVFYPSLQEGKVIVKVNGQFSRRSIGADGKIIVFAGGGNDTVVNFTSFESEFHGGDGADRLIGGAADDELYGDAGRDFISGGGGNDKIFGGADGDVLYGKDGHDLISGEGGEDVIFGGHGNDRMFGGDGRDLIEGGIGDDIALGGLGNDRLTDIGGHNILIGGEGRDSLQTVGGRDILIGGTTAFDADLNATALLAIMAEFNSGAGYRQRVRNIIDNSGNGAGLNAPFFLSIQTVFDDRENDLLSGGGRSDFFPTGEAVDATFEERLDMNSNF